MELRIQNDSEIPTKYLRALIAAALKRVEAPEQWKRTPVFCFRPSRLYCHGWIYKRVDRYLIEILIPPLRLVSASRVYASVVHESKHAVDYERNLPFSARSHFVKHSENPFTGRSSCWRREPHRNRPEERRAIMTTTLALRQPPRAVAKLAEYLLTQPERIVS